MKQINIVTRDGILEPLDIQKIQKYTSKAVKGLRGVSQSELEVDAQLQFREGMTSAEIQQTLWSTAKDKIDIDVPNWTFVSARLFIEDLYHVVGKTLKSEKGNPYGKLVDYMTYGEKNEKIIPGLKDLFHLEDLDNEIFKNVDFELGYHTRDLQFNFLGVKTLYDRYLLKNREGVPFELPQHMFMAICMFIAQDETNIDSVDNKEEILAKYSSQEDIEKAVRTFWALKFYDMVSKFEVMLATPTLSNARTLRHQLSSCYIGSSPDNIEGIFDSYKEKALLSKYGGGIGWDWHNIRGASSFIAGHKGAAGGLVPFLKIENDLAIAVDQLGTRKGAIAVYVEPWHYDIIDILDLKKNSGEERRRAHDIFPAMWIPDLFMDRVINDEMWTIFSSDDVGDLHSLYEVAFKKAYEELENNPLIRKEQYKAKDLWKKMLTSYFETGTPFLTFKDAANRANPNSHAGTIYSSNLCTEIFQNTSANHYRTKIEFNDGTFVIFEEEELVTLDNGIVKKAKHITALDKLHGKRIYIVEKDCVEGKTAVCNLASVNLSKIKTKEDMARVVPVAIRALDNVIDLNFYPNKKTKDTNLKSRAVGLGVMGEAQMLAEEGISYGTQEHFEKINKVMEYFSFYAIVSSAKLGLEKGSYPDFEGSNWSKGIMPFDHANNDVNALTTGEEDCDWFYVRELSKKSMRNGYLMAIAPTSSISILVGTSQAIEPIYKRKWFEENLSGLIPVTAPNLSPDTWAHYVPAYELDQTLLVKAAAIRQKWIDQGQSLNIFMTLDKASGKVLNDIYVLAWKLGLKSTYYLRSESPEAKKEAGFDRSQECEGCQ